MNITTLSNDQLHALISIRDELTNPMQVKVIHQLESGGFIDKKFGGGWRLTGKGRGYLRKHPKEVDALKNSLLNK